MAGTLDAERGKEIWTAEQYAEALGHEAGNRTVGRVQTSPAAVTRSGVSGAPVMTMALLDKN